MWLEWFQEVGPRVANIFRRSQLESEVDEELRFHLEMQIEQYVKSGTLAEWLWSSLAALIKPLRTAEMFWGCD